MDVKKNVIEQNKTDQGSKSDAKGDGSKTEKKKHGGIRIYFHNDINLYI